MLQFLKYRYFSRKRRLPQMVALEIANVCNLKCSICPLFHGTDQMDRQKSKATFMSQELFASLARQIADWEIKPAIYLNMFGEPLLDPGIAEKLYLLDELGLSANVCLQTNATLLDKSISSIILNAHVGRLIPAFDSHIPEHYEHIRCGAKYDNVLKNIINFAKMRNKYKYHTKISIQHVRTRNNKDDYLKTYNVFKPWFTEHDSFNVAVSHSWASTSLNAEVLVFPREGEKERGKACAMRHSMIVLADGRVAACCFDYNLRLGSMGNANNDPLATIWRSRSYFDLHEKIGSDKLPVPCTRCASLLCDLRGYAEEIRGFSKEDIWIGPYGATISYHGAGK